jgi:hypothetical protein
MDGLRVVEGLQRLKGVFQEVPGASMTLPDAASVSGLDQPVCEIVLGAFEDAHFLERGNDGRYRRPILNSLHSRRGHV